jgi:hypothetical protein
MENTLEAKTYRTVSLWIGEKQVLRLWTEFQVVQDKIQLEPEEVMTCQVPLQQKILA